MTKDKDDVSENIQQSIAEFDLSTVNQEINGIIDTLQDAQRIATTKLPAIRERLKSHIDQCNEMLGEVDTLLSQLPAKKEPQKLQEKPKTKKSTSLTEKEEDLGTLLRKLRTEKNWTQQYVSRKSGISAAAIRYMEQGKLTPTDKQLTVLAGLYNTPVSSFPHNTMN